MGRRTGSANRHVAQADGGPRPRERDIGPAASWFIVCAVCALFTIYVILHWDSVRLILGGSLPG
jgi:hypothetical protein